MTKYYFSNTLFTLALNLYYAMVEALSGVGWGVYISDRIYAGNVAIEYGWKPVLLHSNGTKTDLEVIRSLGHIHVGDSSEHTLSDSYDFAGCACVSSDRLASWLYFRQINDSTHAPESAWVIAVGSVEITHHVPANDPALGFGSIDAATWSFIIGAKRMYSTETIPEFLWKRSGIVGSWDGISGVAAAAAAEYQGDGLTFVGK
jgi:hypothetical protein